MSNVGDVFFHCLMRSRVLPSVKGLTTEPEQGLTMLETHREHPGMAITLSEIAFRNPVQTVAHITTKEQRGLMGTIGFVEVLG